MAGTTSGHPAGPAGVRIRALSLVAATVAGVGALLKLVRDAVGDLLAELDTAGWDQVPLAVVVTALAAAALAACGAWLLVATAAATVEALTGVSSTALRAVSPHVVRRLVLVSCGLAVGSAGVLPPAAAAAAEHGHRAGDGSPARRSAAAVAGLPLPDRTVGGTGKGETFRVAAVEPRRSTYVVRPGDSLWGIAKRLVPGADDTRTDAAWRRIHRANRDLVGPDPDLIIPGTTLRLPPHLAPPHRKDES
jgi:LysM domain